MSRKVASSFDAAASDYDRTAFGLSLGTSYISHLETEFVLRNCPTQPGHRVLDIGVGTGRIAQLLAPRGVQVYGIDISPGMLDQAKMRLIGSQVNFTLADAGQGIPFKDASFDFVICFRVIKYIPTWRRTIQEVARVLKPGGIYLLEITNRYSVAHLSGRGQDYLTLSFKEVKEQLEANGLLILRFEAGTRLPFPLYVRVNSLLILNCLKFLERSMNLMFPKPFLSRSLKICCRASP